MGRKDNWNRRPNKSSNGERRVSKAESNYMLQFKYEQFSPSIHIEEKSESSLCGNAKTLPNDNNSTQSHFWERRACKASTTSNINCTSTSNIAATKARLDKTKAIFAKRHGIEKGVDFSLSSMCLKVIAENISDYNVHDIIETLKLLPYSYSSQLLLKLSLNDTEIPITILRHLYAFDSIYEQTFLFFGPFVDDDLLQTLLCHCRTKISKKKNKHVSINKIIKLDEISDDSISNILQIGERQIDLNKNTIPDSWEDWDDNNFANLRISKTAPVSDLVMNSYGCKYYRSEKKLERKCCVFYSRANGSDSGHRHFDTDAFRRFQNLNELHLYKSKLSLKFAMTTMGLHFYNLMKLYLHEVTFNIETIIPSMGVTNGTKSQSNHLQCDIDDIGCRILLSFIFHSSEITTIQNDTQATSSSGNSISTCPSNSDTNSNSTNDNQKRFRYFQNLSYLEINNCPWCTLTALKYFINTLKDERDLVNSDSLILPQLVNIVIIGLVQKHIPVDHTSSIFNTNIFNTSSQCNNSSISSSIYSNITEVKDKVEMRALVANFRTLCGIELSLLSLM